MSDAHPSIFFQFIKAVEPLVGWLLIIVGWLVVRWDNNNRESRRELRDTVDSIKKDIEELEQKAYRYYTMDVTDDQVVNGQLLQVEIKRSQESLEARVALLKKWNKRFQNIEKLSAFRRELTGGDFEQRNRQRHSPTDGKLLEISFAAKELISELEIEYTHQVYKK